MDTVVRTPGDLFAPRRRRAVTAYSHPGGVRVTVAHSLLLLCRLVFTIASLAVCHWWRITYFPRAAWDPGRSFDALTTTLGLVETQALGLWLSNSSTRSPLCGRLGDRACSGVCGNMDIFATLLWIQCLRPSDRVNPLLNSVAMETAESWESLARKDVSDVRVQLGHGWHSTVWLCCWFRTVGTMWTRIMYCVWVWKCKCSNLSTWSEVRHQLLLSCVCFVADIVCCWGLCFAFCLFVCFSCL